MIQNPDMTFEAMSQKMGVNSNTFKANVRHLTIQLKKEGWV